jgi:hypothetical protein
MGKPTKKPNTKEIRARAKAASKNWKIFPEPQNVEGDGYQYIAQGSTFGETLIQLGDTYEDSHKDMLFVQSAREDVLALCDRVEALEKELRAISKNAAESGSDNHGAWRFVLESIAEHAKSAAEGTESWTTSTS